MVPAFNERRCPFCEIAGGDTRAHVVFEDEVSVAFLDKRPLQFGHTLLVPRRHIQTFMALPEALIEPLFSNARLLSRAVSEAMEAEGVLVLMNNKISQSVPHLHIHVVPRHKKDGLRGFLWPRHSYETDEAMGEVAERIRRALKNLRGQS